MIINANDPAAVTTARAAVTRGEVICLPTDTVYGVGADPFSANAVTALLSAKSRTRAMPPPVLVRNLEQAEQLVAWFPPEARAAAEKFWPGALTIILPARPTIGWDLGETGGTVALRMPDNPVALSLLDAGPLAVTSANVHGEPPATTAQEAERQLGEAVTVYLDAGQCGGGVPSTIIRFNPMVTSTATETATALEVALANGEITAHTELAGVDLIRSGAIDPANFGVAP